MYLILTTKFIWACVMLIRILRFFFVSLPARYLYFHINARLFGMMLSYCCCSVLVHLYFRRWKQQMCRCHLSALLQNSVASPFLALARLLLSHYSQCGCEHTSFMSPYSAVWCRAVACCFPQHEAFFMRRLFLPSPKMSLNCVACSRRELATFFTNVSHGRGLRCCGCSLWDPVGLNLSKVGLGSISWSLMYVAGQWVKLTRR